MSVIDTLVIDRAADAKYNYTDLNRVESAFVYLRDKMNGIYGFDLPLSIKTDWTRHDLGQLGAQALMEAYRQNTATIRAALKTLPSTPQTPHSMRYLSAQDANDIERILQDVEWLLERIPHAWRHSGATMAGQGGLIR